VRDSPAGCAAAVCSETGKANRTRSPWILKGLVLTVSAASILLRTLDEGFSPISVYQH
jgi:hypothetical protein